MILPPYMEADLRRTEFRDRVLRFVAEFQAEHRRSPMQKEIAEGVGVATAPSVFRALKILEAEGRIQRVRTQITIL